MSSAGRHADLRVLGRTRRDRAPLRKHRRCDRRRGRASRFHDRLLPGEGRTRRTAAGEDQLPARKGLRRRPHAPGDQAARRDGHRHLRGGRLAAEQGPAHHRRRRPPPARLAGTRLLPGLRTRPQARRLRRAARPPGPEGGRAPVRTLQRRRPDHRRPHRPHHRRARETRRGEDARSPSTPRWWSPPTATPPACPWRWACTAARTARWASRSVRTSPRRATTTTTWSPGWSCGTAAAAEDRLLPGYGWIFGMGDGTSNVGLGVLNTSDSFKELDWREVLKAWCASMPEDWGYTPDNMTGADPRRRPPDGLQPPAALHEGPAARRRRGRPGEPLQRRGHRLRHGVRPDRRRRHRPGPRPGHPGPAGDSRSSATRGCSRTPTAATTRWAAPS